jgi:RND family efflux transporter MFP subunit
MKNKLLIVCLGLAGVAAAAYESGLITHLRGRPSATHTTAIEGSLAPAVSVIPVAKSDFVETVFVTGTLVARDEIIVAPEVDGLRVLELKVDEGDRVKQGDVLAVLVNETLEAQVAQNDAALARAEAAIARAKSGIAEAEARLAEANASLERARPLVKSQYLSESVFDQREAAAKTAQAQLTASSDGLKVAEAEKAQVEAQRRELVWRRSKSEVRSPVDGIVSRRSARIGAIAVGAMIAGAGDPMFRIIARGEVELDAEVTETHMAKIKAGQKARVEAAETGVVDGTVRLVSPEVDKTTRLGRVRIFVGENPALRIGAFARATIETDHARGLAVPQSAILYGEQGATVQVVEDGRVATRRIETGLATGSEVEVRSGLAEADLVVAKAGTFLRDGDAVRTVLPDAEVSEVNR